MPIQKENIKVQLKQHMLINRKRKLKAKKSTPWLYPLQIEKQYEKEIKAILQPFVNVVLEKIKPDLLFLLENNKNIIGDEDKNDSPSDDYEKLSNEEFKKIKNQTFGIDDSTIKSILYIIAILTLNFNNKQFLKTTKQSTGTELFIQERWSEEILKQWITNNVYLIKGMTDDYIKKINNAVLDAFQNNKSYKELSETLTQINNQFYSNKYKMYEVNGKKYKIKKQSRSELIARDQLSKLNSQMTKKRQQEVGVTLYRWNTSVDERVRPSHRVMEGKICSWDDPTIYADTIQDAMQGKWKKRSSIGGVQLHPGQDIQCRCWAEAIWDNVIEEVNMEVL